MINCERCGKEAFAIIMSMFNSQMICSDCKKKEEQYEDYDKAVKEEREAVKRGDYNFKGIGLNDKTPNKRKEV